jgi:hypothetical protein
MKLISDEHQFLPLLEKANQMISASSRLPDQIFLAEFDHFNFFEHHVTNVVRTSVALSSARDGGEWFFLTLESDPTLIFRNRGHYGAFSFDRMDDQREIEKMMRSPESWISGYPVFFLATRFVTFGPSASWALVGEIEAEMLVLGSRGRHGVPARSIDWAIRYWRALEFRYSREQLKAARRVYSNRASGPGATPSAMP